MGAAAGRYSSVVGSLKIITEIHFDRLFSLGFWMHLFLLSC
jgi:hypothetical protein